MKILHITDSHATIKAPSSRMDTYYISFLKKLYEVGYVIKHSNIDLVIHTGDLFHSPHISDKFTGQVAEIIKSFGVPMYVVPGNHDIEGYSIDTLEQTKLGLLYKTGVIKELDRLHPFKLQVNINGQKLSIGISGQEYYAHIDEGNPDDFKMSQPQCDLNILCIHGYVTNVPQHPDIKHTMISNINTDADIVLSGHFHQSFMVDRNDGVGFYNPGSMMRVEQNDYNKNRKPCYGILEISADEDGPFYDYNLYEFKTALDSTIVFDYNTKYIQNQKAITLQNFKTNISNTVSSINTNINITNIIDNLCNTNNIDAEIHKLALDSINDAKNSVPEIFDFKQGYITSLNKVYIKSIEIHNFQSHKDTKIDFDNNLNIIIGESNNGKTSIIRAIMWVIDDYPSGNAFITTGEKDCSVKLTFTNGCYIERGRTLKSSGYYRIGYYDENNNFVNQEFSGFHNEVPVEVFNIHQMPLVNITKDLSTHLNIISQLDKPFLLTESPLIKASAIGRITGTHIIDHAIKTINSVNLTEKKEVKVHTATLTELNDKLNKLPDIDKIKKVKNSIDIVLKKINDTQQCIDLSEQILKSFNDTYNNYQTEFSKKIRYENILKLENISGKFNTLYTEYTTALDLVDKVDFVNNNIYNLKDHLYKNKVVRDLDVLVAKLQVFVNETNRIYKEYELKNKQKIAIEKEYDKYKAVYNLNGLVIKLQTFVNEINRIYDKYELINKQKTATKEEHNKYSSVLNVCEYVLNEINTDNNKLHLAEDIINKFNHINNDIKDNKDKISNLNATKWMVTVDIRDTLNNLLSNGLCPCCGQPIKEEHKDTILKYLSEE